jgi:predicted permease
MATNLDMFIRGASWRYSWTEPRVKASGPPKPITGSREERAQWLASLLQLLALVAGETMAYSGRREALARIGGLLPLIDLLTVMSPVVLVGGVGLIWGRLRSVDTRPLHAVAYYVAGPALVFASMYGSDVTGDSLLRTGLFAVLMYGAFVLLAYALAATRRWDSECRKAAILSLAPTNCANYGLPVIALAFGDVGLSFGIAFVVAHVLIHMTLGVALVAWRKGTGAVQNLTAIAKVPYIYALGLALVFRATSVALPRFIEASVELIGQAWIPLLLLLLGLEIAKVRPQEAALGDTAVLTLAKLLLAPLMALGLCLLLGISGLWRAVLVIQASMPTAVNGVLFARQFSVRPQLVATVLLATTAGSLVTVTLLLHYLG